MKKRIIATIVILLLMTLVCTLITIEVEGETSYSKEQLQSLVEECQFTKDNAATMAASARNLGWTDEDDLIKELQDKWWNANDKQDKYTEQIKAIEQEEARKIEKAQRAEEARWAEKATEYPAATTIWRAFKAQGWNDYVCAGIMGNLMAEVGGQTLNIKWNTSGNGYYGMCQWNQAYRSQIWGADLQGQIDFLVNTIKYEIDTYGGNYNFNSFLNLQDCRTAALVFARSYERCGSASYGVRQKNAVKAYNYFVN